VTEIQTSPDPLDEAIAANKGQGHRYYAETLEIIRERLCALEARGQPYHGITWLIECFYGGSPPDYYCAPAVWCNNPWHARKFQSREEAEAVSSKMTTIGDRRVVEHVWD